MARSAASPRVPWPLVLLGAATLLESLAAGLLLPPSGPARLACALVALTATGVTLLAVTDRAPRARPQVRRVVSTVVLAAVPVAAAVTLVVTAASLREPPARLYTTDAALFDAANASMVLDGVNPYTA